MALPGQMTVADAFIKAPVGTNNTNLQADFNSLLTHLTTAVGNGGLTQNQADAIFYPMLSEYGQQLAVNLAK